MKNREEYCVNKRFDIERFNRHNIDGEYIFTEADGTMVRQNKSVNYYWEESRRADEVFQLYCEFHLNGNIKREGLRYYKGSFAKGVWKIFDIDGNLTKEEDHDIPFEGYSWEDVKEYTKMRGIDLFDRYTYINRFIDQDSQIPIWTISWSNPIRVSRNATKIEIDARNGKIISEKPVSYRR